MMRQRFYVEVKGEAWYITAFYPITMCHVDEIMDALYSVHCNGKDLKEAYANLSSGNRNNGLTYSNYLMRETVIVIALANDPCEYFNSIVHELHHASVQIATANGLDLQGEEVCYINGTLARLMHSICRRLIA